MVPTALHFNKNKLYHIRFLLITATALSAGLIPYSSARAQTTETPPAPEPEQATTVLQDVVVTAARTRLPASALPLTVDVIDQTSLTEQIAIGGSVLEAVTTLSPSFSPTTQKMSGGGQTLRGRTPLYAINNIPQSSPLRYTGRDGFTIDPFFIERVELIYGSNALQGIGATGGVVNQVTVSPPKQEGWSGRLLGQVTAPGGFEDDGFGSKMGGYVGYRQGTVDGLFGATLERRGSFYDGDGRRVGVTNGQGDIQNSRSNSLFGRFGWDVTPDLRFELVANRFELEGNGRYVLVLGDRQTGLPTSSERGTVEGETASNLFQTLSASLVHQDLFGGVLTTEFFYNSADEVFGGDRSTVFQDANIGPIGTVFDQAASRSRKRGARINYEREFPGLPNLTTIVGVDGLQDRVRQDLLAHGRTWVPPIDYRSVAPFVQANLKLWDGRVRLAGGARQENVDLVIEDFTTLAVHGSRFVTGGRPTFSSTLYNAGIIFEPIDGLRTYASYAEGYTMADLGRILRGISVDGIRVDDYVSIDPVVSDNREIGAEYKRGPFELSATYFWSSSKLGQFLIRDEDNNYTILRQPVEIEGLELNGRTNTPIEGLSLSAGYARLRGQNDSDGDGRVDKDLDGANISPDRINLAAIYARGPWSTRLQVQSYLERKFEGGDPRNDFGGYTLADAYLRYDTRVGGISLAIQNLFDKQYITYTSDTANPTLNQAYFAGRGRTFTLTWDRQF